MAYALLWLEALGVSLLLVATLTACTARLRRAGPLVALYALAVFGLLAVHAGAVGVVGYLAMAHSIGRSLFAPVLGLTICVAVGVFVLCRRGLRCRQDGTRPAASWPRGRLAVVLAAAVAVHAVTFWNLDLAARQRLGTLRTEAGALAMSVAPARVPDRDNAAILYEQAFDRLGPYNKPLADWQDRWDDWLEPNSTAFDAGDAEFAAFLKQHEPTLRLLRLGAGKPGCYFELEYHDPGLDMIITPPVHFRRAARLLALAARSRAAAGDALGALGDVRTMFVLAEHTASGPLLIAMLSAIGIDRIAFDTLRAVLPPGGPAEAQLAAVRVEPSVSYRRLFQRALRMEEAFRLTCYAAFDGRRGEAGPLWEHGGLPRPVLAAYRVFLLDDDLASHYRLSAEYAALATKPYHQTVGQWRRIEDQIVDGPIGLLTRMLMPALAAASKRAAEGDAVRGVARTALAALRCRAAQGAWPGTLEELVGDDLPAVPRDPFDDRPLRWKRTERGMVVYSIGPDGTDDGGAPFDRKTRAGDIAFDLPDR